MYKHTYVSKPGGLPEAALGRDLRAGLLAYYYYYYYCYY